MEPNIGQNIKHLRRENDMTQEQLAQLLCISSAAVSKWEAGNSYPDITMLLPLAQIFSVSIDELMGFDQKATHADIERIIGESRRAHLCGDFSHAVEILSDARKKYPHDYQIMHHYMWEIAGWQVDNDPAVLLSHREEFLQICDCILNGCNQEQLRLEALTMKAKLLHASGDTPGALRIFSEFPSSAQNSGHKTEQLFAKDTPEFLYWNEKNMYGMLDGTFVKIARYMWYDPNASSEARKRRIEHLADVFLALSEEEGNDFLSVCAQMLYSFLANQLSCDTNVPEIIRIRQKQFEAMEKMHILSTTSIPLAELLQKTYGSIRPAEWLVEWLTTTKHPQHVSLRDKRDYVAMLEHWKAKLS